MFLVGLGSWAGSFACPVFPQAQHSNTWIRNEMTAACADLGVVFVPAEPCSACLLSFVGASVVSMPP
jgi:hypothetical protein